MATANAFRLTPGKLNVGQGATGNDDQRRKFRLGFDLGGSLVNSGAVFVGVIRSIGETERKSLDERHSIFYTKLDVMVEEWLWNKPDGLSQQVQLTQVSAPEVVNLRQGEWTVWQHVEPRVGERLLVAFNPQRPENQRYAAIIADETIFPNIRDIIILHQRYLQTPGELLEAPGILQTEKDLIFAGYLVSCLSSARFTDNIDNEALVLSELLGSEQIPEADWAWLRVALKWRLGRSKPISPLTRDIINRSLLNAASSTKASLASNALIILVQLSDNKQLDMKPLINEEQRRKIGNNYRALILRGNKLGGHPEFESQLGLNKTY